MGLINNVNINVIILFYDIVKDVLIIMLREEQQQKECHHRSSASFHREDELSWLSTDSRSLWKYARNSTVAFAWYIIIINIMFSRSASQTSNDQTTHPPPTIILITSFYTVVDSIWHRNGNKKWGHWNERWHTRLSRPERSLGSCNTYYDTVQ